MAAFDTSRTFFAFVWRRDRQGYANVHRQSVQAVTMDMLTVMLRKGYCREYKGVPQTGQTPPIYSLGSLILTHTSREGLTRFAVPFVQVS